MQSEEGVEQTEVLTNLLRSSGLMFLILRNDIECFKFKIGSGRIILKKTILWSEMGSSVKLKLHGVTPRQQTKSKTWPLL